MKPVTEHLVDELRARAAHGFDKYQQTLDRHDLSLADWLQHQKEEQLDAAGYAEAARRLALTTCDVLDRVVTEVGRTITSELRAEIDSLLRQYRRIRGTHDVVQSTGRTDE